MRVAQAEAGQTGQPFMQKAYPNKTSQKKLKSPWNRQKTDPSGQFLPVRQPIKRKREKRLK
jgi:hypothetical protein